MKVREVFAIFDSHTPYLEFRVNALQDAIAAEPWSGQVRLTTILIGAEEKSYGWESGELQSRYKMPLVVLSERFRGLGLRSFLHPSVPKCLWRLGKLLLSRRPKVIFVGGYDRPESMLSTVLCRFWGGRTGVWNDSKFNDSESFARCVWLEVLKALMVGRYAFFMCAGRESADYHRFLGGRKKIALTGSWNVVDNESIAKGADSNVEDDAIRKHLGIEERFFFMPIRFVAKKNVDRVIKAYASYAKDAEVLVPMVICGKGPLEAVYQGLIREAGLEDSIRIVSWLPYAQVPRACRLAEAVLLASTHDQWGMTINEALAAGAPVLVSNRCGAHELVQNYRNGFTFDPFNVEHLAYLIATLATDTTLVAKLRNNARESMKGFAIDGWVRNHLSILKHFGVAPIEN